MKYYFICGEASGDLHASFLLNQLKLMDKDLNCRGWGGNLLQEQGCFLVKHYKNIAFMGFWEVVINLKTIFKNIKFCKLDIQIYKPDLIVLVDYPGFNLRIANWAKKKGFKIAYYISPQVWAWKSSRVKKMKKNIDSLISIIPFEKEYFKKIWSWDIHYVGNPILEELEVKLNKPKWDSDQKIIALLPGSRQQEIKQLLPLFLKVRNPFPNYKFIVAAVSTHPKDFYHKILKDYDVEIVYDDSINLLNNSHLALVTSGTASLETACLEVPQIVCYKTSSITFFIAKLLVKIKYISMVNLILHKEVVPELIQNQCNLKNIELKMRDLINDSRPRTAMISDYKKLKVLLQDNESPSKKAAQLIYNLAVN